MYRALMVLGFVAWSVALVAGGMAYGASQAARGAAQMRALGVTPTAPRPALVMTDCREALRACAARRRMDKGESK